MKEILSFQVILHGIFIIKLKYIIKTGGIFAYVEHEYELVFEFKSFLRIKNALRKSSEGFIFVGCSPIFINIE